MPGIIGQSADGSAQPLENASETQTPRMGSAGCPADNVGVGPVLHQDVPQRLAAAGSGRHRTHAAGIRVQFGEAEDAVLVRELAGGNRVPQHRRQHRIERLDVAHDAVIDQKAQIREFSPVE
ncbi:MAG: hypothetical protein R2762_28755 [Bryobacteraceae bacterium]